MKDYKYQIKIILTFITMLFFGMLVQSALIFSLNVRDSVHKEQQFSEQYLEQKAIWVNQKKYMKDELQKEISSVQSQYDRFGNKPFNCEYIAFITGEFSQNSVCDFPEMVKEVSRKVVKNNDNVEAYTHRGTTKLFFKEAVVIVGVPVKDNNGDILGSIVAERTLTPIYQKFKSRAVLVFCYFMVNLVILSTLFYVRISKLIFRPIENLVDKADSYQSDESTFLMANNSENPFRKLSASLNSFLVKIEKDNHSLRQHVRELESLNSELQEKNELVVRSEKLATVGVLSAGLAHEIGNPLSIVQGYVDLLRRHDLDHDEKLEFTQKAQDELNRIKRLILQLLDYSRADGLAEVGNFSICEVIESVVEFVSFEKKLSHCSIQTIYPDGDQYIVCSDDHLKQVLVNCLLNAADATSEIQDEKRTIIITASVLKEKGKESSLCIDIVDNGSGVNEEHLSSLFDPFFTTKDIGKGTGLGLFVSYMIMEKMGGSITLKNAEEGGAVVRLVLPLKK